MTRHVIPIIGIVATIVVASYMVVRFNAQETVLQGGDFRNASTAEIRDADGQVVMRGTFELVEEEDDDIERKAPLIPAGGGDAAGEAEVEFATEMPADQEVEFEASGLTAGAAYALVVDGEQVTTTAADERGRIAIEVDIPLPGAAGSR